MNTGAVAVGEPVRRDQPTARALAPPRVPPGLLVLAGFVLLMARLLVPAGRAEVPELAIVFGVLGAISVAVPAVTGASLAIRPQAAFGLGALAFASVSLWLRHPLPVVASGEVLAMNTIAAVAEEAFFRRLLYGRLLRFGAPVAVAGSAVAFAVVHVPVYGSAALWVDLGAGLILSWQRWATGGWAAPAATHVFANLLAVLR